MQPVTLECVKPTTCNLELCKNHYIMCKCTIVHPCTSACGCIVPPSTNYTMHHALYLCIVPPSTNYTMHHTLNLCSAQCATLHQQNHAPLHVWCSVPPSTNYTMHHALYMCSAQCATLHQLYHAPHIKLVQCAVFHPPPTIPCTFSSLTSI